MSAEQYGRRLLEEVHEEGLHELLKSIRTTLSPTPKDILGIPELDHLLELFRYQGQPPHRQSPGWTTPGIAEVLSNIEEHQDGYTIPAQATTTVKPPVIELTSSSTTGKSQLLYLLTTHALLPRYHHGKESCVVYIDTDGRFSSLRLSEILHSVITKASTNQDATIKSIIHQSLSHLHIIRPTTSASLLSTLHSIPVYLLSSPHPSSSRPLGLLILDSATAFTYQDRFNAEIARIESSVPPAIRSSSPTKSTAKSRPSDSPPRAAEIISALKELQEQFECTILFTTTTTNYPSVSSSTNPPPPPPPEIPCPLSPWTPLTTLPLRLSPIPTPQFAPRMTLQECLRDREKRQTAVAQGRVAVAVDWRHADVWPAGLREKVLASPNKGRFVLRLTRGGVEVE